MRPARTRAAPISMTRDGGIFGPVVSMSKTTNSVSESARVSSSSQRSKTSRESSATRRRQSSLTSSPTSVAASESSRPGSSRTDSAPSAARARPPLVRSIRIVSSTRAASRGKGKAEAKQEEVIERFRRTGALLEGHFVLTSGLHSTRYLQCALVLQYPAEAESFGRAVAERFRGQNVETVVAPAIGGIIIGWEVARALGVRSIWTEREEGRMTLRRGFTVRPGEKILVVERSE